MLSSKDSSQCFLAVRLLNHAVEKKKYFQLSS